MNTPETTCPTWDCGWCYSSQRNTNTRNDGMAKMCLGGEQCEVLNGSKAINEITSSRRIAAVSDTSR